MKYAVLLIILLPLGLLANNVDSTKIIHHEHHRNEIGIGNSPVYFVNENTFSYGLHIHYLYNLNNRRFGLGAGYEKIFDEHKHNAVTFTFCYRPVEKLNFNVSPGIAFENSEFKKSVFAIHFETSYEFEIHDFHLGPVLEFALDKEDIHISLGLHIGVGF